MTSTNNVDNNVLIDGINKLNKLISNFDNYLEKSPPSTKKSLHQIQVKSKHYFSLEFLNHFLF